MKYLSKKYKNSAALIFLSAYVFFISLTVFHYHHVGIQLDNSRQIENTAGRQSSPFDKLIDLTHDDCSVQQFASSILNFSFTGTFESFVNNSHESITSFPAPHEKNQDVELQNPLRAPPSVL